MRVARAAQVSAVEGSESSLRVNLSARGMARST